MYEENEFNQKILKLEREEQVEIIRLGEVPKLENYHINIEEFINVKVSVEEANISNDKAGNFIGCIFYPISIGIIIRLGLESENHWFTTLAVPLIVLSNILVNKAISSLTKSSKINLDGVLQNRFPEYLIYKKAKDNFDKNHSEIKHKFYSKRKDLEFQNITSWKSLNGIGFEIKVEEWFCKNGFNTNRTTYSNDKGVDIFISKNDKKYIVQCKAHKNKIGPHTVRDLFGTFYANDVDGCILITLTGFTKGVYDFVKNKPIFLINLKDIIDVEKKVKNIENLLSNR